MGLIDDILKALDRIPVWRRLNEVPAEVDELKERVASLEEKLGGKWPPDVCKHCGARALRMSGVRGPNVTTKKMMETWVCAECNMNEVRHV